MAGSSTRARRYAEAVFEVARDHGTFDLWLGELGEVELLLADQLAAQVLRSPAIPGEAKARVLERTLPDLAPEVRRFVGILLRRGTFSLLPEIVAAFRRRVDQARGVQSATVTTAVPLQADERQLLEARLTARSGKQIRLEERVDPNVLGGVIAQIGDEIIDGSVRGRLERLRRALAGT